MILTFDLQAGHEQKGRRPALVVSHTLFNRHTGLAMVCPITKAFRKIPFHVAVPEESSLKGSMMAEQFKSVDSAKRRMKFIEKAPGFVLDEVLGILDACLYALRNTISVSP